MATVTGGGQTTFINVGSNDANGVAQALANVISAGLQGGTLTRVASAQNNPPTGSGVATISTSGAPVLINAPGVSVDLINATSSTTTVGGASQNIVGSGLPNQQVLGDNENITYFTNGGGGSFIFGDGNDIFGTPTIGGGVISNIQTGTGNDTINIYSGIATVSAGLGSNVINTGMTGTTSNVLIFASGNDAIRSTGGSGTDTVIAGNGNTVITEATKNLVFNGQGGTGHVTVNGGLGSETVLAGPGGGVIGGGAAGNNLLYGGTAGGASTLFGGGNNDVLFARTSSATTVLIAGAGNETLTGAASTSNNVYIAGANGNTTVGGGTGNDSVYVGNPGTTTAFSGNVAIDAGLGSDLISFTNRGSGVTANVLINNFQSSSTGDNDQLQLIGFSNQQAAITNAAASAGTVTLSDGTRITFGTAVNLNNSNFA